MQKTLRIKNDIHELSMMNEFLEEAGEELGLSTAFMMSLNLVMGRSCLKYNFLCV